MRKYLDGIFGRRYQTIYRMGGRAVEGTGLENRQGCKLFVGSNPTPSAIFKYLSCQGKKRSDP